MPESKFSVRTLVSRSLLVPIALGLIALFVVLRFPWDSLGRRIAWEINRVSAANVEIDDLRPGLSARGPVLRATDVRVTHPAVERLLIPSLEIAPRFSTSWLAGDPTVRIWAETSLGNADGVLRLGAAPAYVGRMTNVELARLPLRFDEDELRLFGRLDADADVMLDPDGTLRGDVTFESDSLRLQTAVLPVQIPFAKASGRVEILESGATRISDVALDGPVVAGTLGGEIGLVHRSQSPPLDLRAELRVLDPTLRRLAPTAGLVLGPNGEASLAIGGTAEAPTMRALRAGAPR